MQKWFMYIALIVVGMAVLASCESEVSSPQGAVVPVWEWEAERAVMLFGLDPAVETAMVAEIGEHLRAIRSTFGRRFYFDGHRVHYPWDPFRAVFDLTPEGLVLFESGDWPEFEAALATVGADSAGTVCGYLSILLPVPTSPCLVADAFADVEHCKNVGPLWRDFFCDDPCGFIWPIRTGRGMAYLFEYRFDGDADSPPEPRTYQYFHVYNFEGPRFIGSYSTDDDSKLPDWWDEMEAGRDYGCND